MMEKILTGHQSAFLDEDLAAKRACLEKAQTLLLEALESPEQYEHYLNIAEEAVKSYRALLQATGRLCAPCGYKLNTRHMHASMSQTATISSADIPFYGLHDVKEEIALKIMAPLKDPSLFTEYGRKAKTGILMYGPPGCGKSLLAEVLAKQAGISFFHIKASDLKSKWVGESEQRLAQLFADARRAQPSLIFIDEFECLGRSRSLTNQTFEKNLVSQLLVEMDGFGTKDQQIIVIAATNEPWDIDPAFLRSGRLGTKIFVGPPNRDTRAEILQGECKNRPLSPTADLAEIARLTEGFSSADIVALCDSAADEAIKEYYAKGTKEALNTKHFKQALCKLKPITKSWFTSALREINNRGLGGEYGEVLSFTWS